MVARKGSADTESGGALGGPFFACAAERLTSDMKDRFTLPAMFLIFVILAAGIVAAGCLHYQRRQERYRTAVENNLAGIADLKVGDLSTWRKV